MGIKFITFISLEVFNRSIREMFTLRIITCLLIVLSVGVCDATPFRNESVGLKSRSSFDRRIPLEDQRRRGGRKDEEFIVETVPGSEKRPEGKQEF